jgi:hypothetical protein
MKRVHFVLLVLFLVSIRLAQSAEMPAVIDRPRADDGPTHVSIGIWIIDINSIDSAQQSFTAEFAVVLRLKIRAWRIPATALCAIPSSRFGIRGWLL